MHEIQEIEKEIILYYRVEQALQAEKTVSIHALQRGVQDLMAKELSRSLHSNRFSLADSLGKSNRERMKYPDLHSDKKNFDNLMHV